MVAGQAGSKEENDLTFPLKHKGQSTPQGTLVWAAADVQVNLTLKG